MTGDPISLRLATRPGEPARVRGALLAARLRELDPALAIEPIVVELEPAADGAPRHEHDPAYTHALRQALLEGEADILAHALKDLPPATPRGIRLAAVPLRDDPRECLVASGRRKLADLPPGARVGADGEAREASLRRLRPDLDIRRSVGPLAQRLARVDAGELDAAVLALSPVRRAGLAAQVTDVFSVADILPGAGQGAGAVEILEREVELGRLLNKLDHLASRWCVLAEREFEQAATEAGALVLGVYGELRDMNLHLRARVLRDGEIFQGADIRPAEQMPGMGRALAERTLASAPETA